MFRTAHQQIPLQVSLIQAATLHPIRPTSVVSLDLKTVSSLLVLCTIFCIYFSPAPLVTSSTQITLIIFGEDHKS